MWWVAVFVTAVGLLVLMKHPPRLPASLTRLMTYDITVPKIVERTVMALIALAVLAWLIRSADDTLRRHYFCERHPEAMNCPQAGDTRGPDR